MQVVGVLFLGMFAALWLPLVGVIAASRFRTSPSAGRRRFGRVLAFFSMWAMFNVSACATWGAFRLGHDISVGLIYVFLGAQVVAPWLCAQIIATAPGHDVERRG